MAGFYETLMSYQQPYSMSRNQAVFGQAATMPGIVAISNDNINNLRNSVAQAQSELDSTQKAYDNLMSSKPQQYNFNPRYDTYDDHFYGHNYGNPYQKQENPAYTSWQSQLNNQQSKLSDARTALQNNQTALQDAIARQGAQITAGQDAVNWGLAAKNAEAQGLQNAMQAYQTAMGNEAVRNAIMNGAIGTVGNFGGGK